MPSERADGNDQFTLLTELGAIKRAGALVACLLCEVSLPVEVSVFPSIKWI